MVWVGVTLDGMSRDGIGWDRVGGGMGRDEVR